MFRSRIITKINEIRSNNLLISRKSLAIIGYKLNSTIINGTPKIVHRRFSTDVAQLNPKGICCIRNNTTPYAFIDKNSHFNHHLHHNNFLNSSSNASNFRCFESKSHRVQISSKIGLKAVVSSFLSQKILKQSLPLFDCCGRAQIHTISNSMAPVQSSEYKRDHPFDYDLIVIGGGSGGLAASKEAAALGKKVALLDFVTPTPHGVSWGVGGTCVNVGCIPKKLMHHAALIGSELEDAHFFGWQTKDGEPLKNNLRHDWSTLVNYVQNNIKGSNFSYRALLTTNKVKYINAYGLFVDPHKIRIIHKNSKEEFLTSKDFIIATGERPAYPDCEGAIQYSITSDDLFSLPYNPGKTLVVGASYVALECAGFLRGLGNDVSVMVRSIVLRGFDRQCSEHVRNYLENIEHVRFIDKCVMKRIEQIKPGTNDQPPLLRAIYRSLETNEEFEDEFNTVMFAVGRKPCTGNIGLEAAGVLTDSKGYIPTNNEQTNVSHIYAVGDIVQGKPQLTPVAIEAGILLVRRLYADQQVNCDYVNVPTTVFTPLEYACCGYNEEEAIQKFGADNIEVYHQYFTPTEWKLNYYDRPRKPMNVCYAKVITTRAKDNDPRYEFILGFHYVGPNAGEVVQFTSLPLKMKATKADLDAMIGIHPTCAEIFTMLPISKRSGKEATQQGCCG
ncbi:zinc finger C2H2 [Sarcoptes scabiei]|nr:zinc finger C2H2 [Sarcoptes scabiei]